MASDNDLLNLAKGFTIRSYFGLELSSLMFNTTLKQGSFSGKANVDVFQVEERFQGAQSRGMSARLR